LRAHTRAGPRPPAPWPPRPRGIGHPGPTAGPV